MRTGRSTRHSCRTASARTCTERPTKWRLRWLVLDCSVDTVVCVWWYETLLFSSVVGVVSWLVVVSVLCCVLYGVVVVSVPCYVFVCD